MSALSNLAILESSYDGRVPPRLRQLAETIDAGNRARRAPQPPAAAVRVRIKPDIVIARMAEIMVEHVRTEGAASVADLTRAGCTTEQIALYGDAAKARCGLILAGLAREVTA